MDPRSGGGVRKGLREHDRKADNIIRGRKGLGLQKWLEMTSGQSGTRGTNGGRRHNISDTNGIW
ncbi:hypothetical protein BC937DRAFT_94778 [Endogone sp. FLAS-F59071]|nr:hypothetical protein BC937DRAFT_94778 [Endogone sp. FLAS-F59071]|eukprot:RUS13788.1 hypothetical protein BC937DRAFT_94778 [Endogone sp. FLAS-F59071]